MIIVIPSKGRSKRQLTLEALSAAGIKPFIVVPEKERLKYQKAVGDKAICMPCPEQGIAATRAWILNFWKGKKVFMLDDDMRFYFRPQMKKPTLQKLSPKGLKKMLKRIEKSLDKHVMVGVSARQGNNHKSVPYVLNTLSMNCYASNVPKLRKAKIKFGRTPLMEDFDITLQILRKGMTNKVYYRYAWNQTGSNAAGGCSTYRTWKLQKKAAKLLAKLHPSFVKVVKKTSKVAWDGMKSRYDVRVSWQKAFKERR